MKVLFCPMLPDIRESVALFQGSHTSSACPSDKNSTKTKMNMEREWVDTDREKPKCSDVYLSCIQNSNSYLTDNTVRVCYQDQPVLAI